MGELDESIKELLSKGQTPIQARTQLLQQGFLEDEVDRALNTTTRKQRSSSEKKTNRLLTVKETLDRIGYGFATPQFINILFFMSGAGFFLIGLFNGLKTILSLLLSSILLFLLLLSSILLFLLLLSMLLRLGHNDNNMR